MFVSTFQCTLLIPSKPGKARTHARTHAHTQGLATSDTHSHTNIQEQAPHATVCNVYTQVPSINTLDGRGHPSAAHIHSSRSLHTRTCTAAPTTHCRANASPQQRTHVCACARAWWCNAAYPGCSVSASRLTPSQAAKC